jgi:hypothetical protein
VPEPLSNARIQVWSRGVFCNALFNPASVAFDLTNVTAGETANADLFTQVRPVVKPFSKEDPMSFQEQSISAKKTQGVAPDRLREVNLIGLAANLDDPLFYRKLSIILEKLKSIDSTRTQQRGGNLALRRYIE